MWPAAISRGLSLPKVIGGISKTLQVASQIIPLYQKAMPMISNARTAFKVLKQFSKSDNNNSVSTTNVTKTNNKEIITKTEENYQKKESNSAPTFFL